MNKNLSLLRKYDSEEEAKRISELLSENKIESRIRTNPSQLDTNFTGSSHIQEFEIFIQSKNFKKAEDLISVTNNFQIDEVPTDYYLFEFTEDELLEIFEKPEEWGDFDRSLAIQLLNSKGKTISQGKILKLKETRILELKKHEPINKNLLIAGYIFSILGGIGGLLIGYLIWSSKKNIPNGERIFTHSLEDRKKAKNLIILSLIFLFIYLIYKIYIL